MPRWALWVAALIVVLPPLLLGGFLSWLDSQTGGIIVGRDHLKGTYLHDCPTNQDGPWVSHSTLEGKRYHAYLFIIGDRGYYIEWWEGAADTVRAARGSWIQ